MHNISSCPRCLGNNLRIDRSPNGKTTCSDCGWSSEPGHKLSKEDVLRQMATQGVQMKNKNVTVSVLPVEDLKIEVHIGMDTVRELEKISEDTIEGILCSIFSSAISNAIKLGKVE